MSGPVVIDPLPSQAAPVLKRQEKKRILAL